MEITKPTLFLDEVKCKSNIKRMMSKTQSSNVKLAPHFKTHQSREIGSWFREVGVEEITVSSVTMARYFLDDGWKRLFIAVPVNIHELAVIKEICEIAEVTLLVCDLQSIDLIQNQDIKASVYIEIDCGYHRSGVLWKDTDLIKEIGNRIEDAPTLLFRGFYCHDGNSYSSHVNEIQEIHSETVLKLNGLKALFSDLSLEVSLGDTPSCSIISEFKDIDVVRPGNFVFYDLVQESIGSCQMDDIAVSMICPVISINNDRNEVIIYGGGVHFSKDRINTNGSEIYGLIVEIDEKFKWGHPIHGCYLRSISQEHGIVILSEEYISKISIGSYLGILPVHSCMTADKMGFYLTSKEFKQIDHLSGNPEYYLNSLIDTTSNA